MAPIESGVIERRSNTTVLDNAEQEGRLLRKIERIFYFGTKRIFDLLCAILGCLLLLPVALVTKICYLATGDRKSIFYKQKRIGKKRTIYIYL